MVAAGRVGADQSLRARGQSVEGAGRLIYLGASRFYSSFPTQLLMRWQGRKQFTRKRIDQRRREAAASQQRRHPDDWVFSIVEGDGQGFEWGIDYTECGIVTYLARQGAPELAAMLCWLDYPVFAAMRVRLIRTETIAQGCQRCDFRFSRGQPVKVTPAFLNAP